MSDHIAPPAPAVVAPADAPVSTPTDALPTESPELFVEDNVANPVIAFIGGGNMASALIGGLIGNGMPAAHIRVVEPSETARSALKASFGIEAEERPGTLLRDAQLIVWAVKPQVFREAALTARPLTSEALHLSIAAGIRSSSIAQWLGTDRIVRAMPNTPALIGRGISGLFARNAVTGAERNQVEELMGPTGETLWVEQESQLDAVTALSGSGPAYVFYFLEAMARAGEDLGLSAQDALRLAISTFSGAAELARNSDAEPAQLRQRVTSKGGTTHAAISSLEDANVAAGLERAMAAAHRRAKELGEEFGT